MKVAIVADWLVGTGGAERVVLELHKMFPDAPIYTSQYNADPKVWYGDKWFADADVRTGWLQRLPIGLRKFLPVLRGWYFSRLDLSDYDLVISSSGAEAKFVKTGKTPHISYCHAPTHYYWARYEQYLEAPGFGVFNPLAKLALKILVRPMRRLDKKAASRPTYLIANSNFTARQIERYYGRQATVIHPPVDVARFKLLNKSSNSRKGFLIAGRQTPYKRFDLAIKACTKLQVPLTVIGSGPEHEKLKRMAGPTVQFLNHVSDKQIVKHFASSEAFLFPGIDDFGIVAVEALASGTPVIAYNDGGALDYIKPQTGALFNSLEGLIDILRKFDGSKFDPKTISEAAQVFNPANFQANFKSFIKEKIDA